MPGFGITPAGFYPKPFSELVDEIEQSELTTIDAELVTDPQQPIGQVNGVTAEKHAEIWELLAVVVSMFNRDNAEGAMLDNIGALTGCLRLTPRPSFVFCTLAFSATGTYVAGSLVAYPTGYPTQQWSNAQDIVIGSTGTQPQPYIFTSIEDGPDPATFLNGLGINTLTQMVAVSGWTSVTNPQNATPGTLEEDDPSYRLRQEEELAAAGSSTMDSIKADLLQVEGVISVQVLENTTRFVDSNNLPPFSFCAVVFDGVIPAAQNAQLAQVLWDSKPAGIQMYGTTLAQAVDSQGNPQNAYFSRPVQLPVYISVTVTLNVGASILTVAPAIKAALVAASQGNQDIEFDNVTFLQPQALQEPGVLVSAVRYAGVASGVSGVQDVTSFQLDYHSSPTNTASLPVLPTQIAVLDSGRILVNGI